jgi:hypothetical protein
LAAFSFGVLFTPVVLLSSHLAPTTTESPDTATDQPKRSSAPVLLAFKYACWAMGSMVMG